MEQKIESKKSEQQKKMLLILPLLAIPFATMFFWAMGGGKAAHAQAAATQLQGLNMKVPGAKLKNDSTENKLGFYQHAEADSMKFKQLRKDDPYYKADTATNIIKNDTLKHYDTGIIPQSENIGHSFSTRRFSNTNANLAENEQQITQKLAALNRQINQPTPPVQQSPDYTQQGSDRTEAELSALKAEMQKMNSTNAGDPQMQQLNGMLDKIQEIQNPALVRQKLKAQSEKERGMVLPVSSSGNAGDGSIMQGTVDSNGYRTMYSSAPQQNGFYDLGNESNQDQDGNAVEAVVHETQTLTSGSTIKMRLLQDIFINGRLIPKETFVFGTCSIEGERLTVDIKTIRYHSSVFPVSMKVFDQQDGLSGIYVPGAIARDAAKDGTDQAIQSYDPMSYAPSLGAQAATAGITMAKGFFSKKVKLVKVTVKAGYSVLLLNSNQLNK